MDFAPTKRTARVAAPRQTRQLAGISWPARRFAFSDGHRVFLLGVLRGEAGASGIALHHELGRHFHQATALLPFHVVG